MRPKRSPVQQRHFIIGISFWAVSLLVCGILIALGGGKEVKLLAEARLGQMQAREDSSRMSAELTDAAKLSEDYEDDCASLNTLLSAHLLVPENNFHEIRARFMLLPFAQTNRFALTKVETKWKQALPGGSAGSTNYLGRIGLLLEGRGSYKAISGFVATAEKELPYFTVSGLTIKSQKQYPEIHDVSMQVEWPVAGVPAAPAGRKR